MKELADQFIAALPPHKCDLHITHNQHLAYYQTAADYILNKDGCGCDHEWKDDESKTRAMATSEIWEMQWYPNTPISSFVIAAPTLAELLEFAQTIK